MDERELPSSDESDVDYIPSGAESNPASEVESDGEEESASSGGDDDATGKKICDRKRGRKTSKKNRKKVRLSEECKGIDESKMEAQKSVLSEEEEKKKADSLWSDFLKDTGTNIKTNSKPNVPNGSTSIISDEKCKINQEKENKVTITKVYEFAGEEIKVTKEVSATSVEAKVSAAASSNANSVVLTKGRTSGGLSSILGHITGKKEKLGTLEKSKLDWDRYKRNEGIEEEIQKHNKGRDGYLDKIDFLQRTDVRQFEIEKQLRSTRRSNR